MPLSFPVLERDDDGRWFARCRTCGWTSKPIAVKAAADYERRLHGTEKSCTRGVVRLITDAIGAAQNAENAAPASVGRNMIADAIDQLKQARREFKETTR